MLRTLTLLTVVMVASPALAQFGGPGGGGMRPGMPGGGAQPGPGPGEEKEEGPAEKAPEQQAENPALQPLPAWPQQREKTLQFFQLNGYIRFRSYLFHALNLGQWESNQAGNPKPPFVVPYTEYNSDGTKINASNSAASCAKRDNANCRTDNVTSADMRLRLEPTVNVTEQVRVKAQLDIFDNLVMGSTPQGYYINNAGGKGGASSPSGDVPYAFGSRSAQAPEAGVNSVYSSIRAKRAWAEVKTPFGELAFGRMPDHWGAGMMVNNGDCLDCDYGTNVDRVMFSTKLWGHFFAFMWDWIASGPTTQIVGPQQGQGVFYNADTLDDVSQWTLALGRNDRPEEIKEKLDQGKAVFNYGGRFSYRQQDWDQTGVQPSGSMYPANTGQTGNSNASLQASIYPRHAKAFTPDIWLRLNWKKLTLEAEGAMMVGTIGSLSDIYGPGYQGATSILSGGFIAKANYKFLHDALKIYLEVGFASGDDWEDVAGNVNFRTANRAPGSQHNIGRFNFDPDYHVDLILFRRILGTVNNAVYYKPGISYDIVDNFGARVDLMYAMAQRPVAYPGNSYNLGLEIDAQLLYKNEEEGFYAGLVYGVLFPFSGLGYPDTIYGSHPTFSKDSPDIAQTFQARLIVKF